MYLQLISRFDLANKVPVEGEITFTDLAAIIGVDRAALCCILRLGIAYHIFKEPRPGVILTLQLPDKSQRTRVLQARLRLT